MPAEISYDLVMRPDMDFVEGSYRLSDGEWRVFIFTHGNVSEPVIEHGRFKSTGRQGVVVHVPQAATLNQAVVELLLSRICEVEAWKVVAGPDSMTLR